MPASRRQRQVANVTRHKQMTDTIRQLQDHTQNHLTDQEQLSLFSAISNYQAQHNVTQLVEQLVPLLNTPAKKQLLRHIRYLVLQGDLVVFDKLLVVHRLWPPSSPTSQSQAPASVGLRQTVSPLHNSVDRQPVALQQTDGPQRTRLPTPMKVVIRPADSGALGFDIRGGAEHGLGIFISDVVEGSQASEKGLRPGQLILKANGVDFDKVTHDQAVEVLTRVSGNIKKLRLTVLPSGQYPSEAYPLVQYYWLDSLHRPTSPPPEYTSGANLLQPVIQPPAVNTRKISMAVRSSQRVGLSIRGGVEHGLGIYVSHVEPGTVADNYSIKVGDQILDINGLNCNTMLHDEVADILLSNDVLVMTIRNIDKIPIRAITPMDNSYISLSPHSRPHSPQKGQIKRSATVSGSTASASVPVSPRQLQRPASTGPTADGYMQQVQQPPPQAKQSLNRRQLKELQLQRASGSFDAIDSHEAVVHAAPAPIAAARSTRSFGGQTVWRQPHATPVTPSAVGPVQHNTAEAIRTKINNAAAEVLNDDELQTLNYYLDQYMERNLSIKQLVLALSTLLDSKEKRNLLNEIRPIISSRDVDRYNELVLPLFTEDMTVQSYDTPVESAENPAVGAGKSRKPPPPSRKESLVDYAAFGTSSFGHRVEAASDSENSSSGQVDSPVGTLQSTMATRSSTLNSDVTFASPTGSLLPGESLQMQQHHKHEQEAKDSPSPVQPPVSIQNNRLLSPPQLRVYEEEFGESPNPQRRPTPRIIKSSDDSEEPSTIPVGHLRNTNRGLEQNPATTLERDQHSSNPQFMLAQSLVNRRAHINPGSMRRVVIRNGVPRSLSLDSTASGLTQSEEPWDDDDEAKHPNPHRRTSGQHRVSHDKLPSTITEEKEISPSISPTPSRRTKPESLSIDSPPVKDEANNSPIAKANKRTPDKRPPSPTTAMNAILSMVKEPFGQKQSNLSCITQPSPKMPRRQVLPGSSPKEGRQIGALQPIPLPRSPSQQTVESPPQARPRKSIPESPLTAEREQQSTTHTNTDSPSESHQDIANITNTDSPSESHQDIANITNTKSPPTAERQQDSPNDVNTNRQLAAETQQEHQEDANSDTSEQEQEDLSPPNNQSGEPEVIIHNENRPADSVQHMQAESGDLYAIPDKGSLQRGSSGESHESNSDVLADAHRAQRSVTEVEVAGSSEITGQVHSVRPGKTFAGYTGLHGDIKTILIEKTKERLGIAVTGGNNTRQKEVRIREITSAGAAAQCGALRLGMQILAVDGKTLKGLPHMQAVMVIKQAYDSSRLRLEMVVHVDDSVL